MADVPRASPVTADASTDVSAQTQSAACRVRVSPAEVLITEQEVRLGTAAAVPLRRREKIARRLVAIAAQGGDIHERITPAPTASQAS
jgi:hypothetical protein